MQTNEECDRHVKLHGGQDSMGSSNIYLIKTQNKNKNRVTGENSVQTFSSIQNMGNIWKNNS